MRGKADRTKKALANSLKELMCEQDFERISVNSICERTDVTRRSFYHHFLDKYDLLHWIYDQDFSYDFNEHPDWSIADYFPVFCRHLYNNRAFYLKAYQITGQNGFREHSYEWLYPLLHRDFGDCFYSDEQERTIFQFSCHLTFDSIINWLRSEPCASPDEFAISHMGNLSRFFKKCGALFDEALRHQVARYDNKPNSP